MLTLRNEQVAILKNETSKPFKQALEAHLQEVLPEKGVRFDGETLKKQIEEGIRRASYYKLTRQRDVARYIELACGNFGGFLEGRHPKAVRQILYDHRLSPEEKLDRVEEWIESKRGRRPARE